MKIFKILFLFLVFIAIIGFVFAMFWQVPVPEQKTEKIIELQVQPMSTNTSTNMGATMGTAPSTTSPALQQPVQTPVAPAIEPNTQTPNEN